MSYRESNQLIDKYVGYTGASGYHIDRNALTAVLEKIEAGGCQILNKNEAGQKRYTCAITCCDEDFNALHIITAESIISRHDATYKAVVDYIKWINLKQ